MISEEQRPNVPINQNPDSAPPKIDPTKLIVREPLMIKESLDIPSEKNKNFQK